MFYMYATISAAALHALIMYIEACIRIPVPEIYGYNVGLGRYTDASMHRDFLIHDTRIDTCPFVSISATK